MVAVRDHSYVICICAAFPCDQAFHLFFLSEPFPRSVRYVYANCEVCGETLRRHSFIRTIAVRICIKHSFCQRQLNYLNALHVNDVVWRFVALPYNSTRHSLVERLTFL